MNEADLAKILAQVTQEAANHFIAGSAEVESDGRITISHGSRLVRAIALTPANGRWLVFQSGDLWYAIASVQNQELSSEVVHQRRQRRRKKIDYPWAYLFEVNEFTDLTVPFSDPSWSFDETTGVFRPFGDGGGKFKTEADIVDFYSGSISPRGLPYDRLESQTIQSFSLQTALAEQVYTGFPLGRYGNEVLTDGVYHLALPKRSPDEIYLDPSRTSRPLIPNRQYWVEESITTKNWGIFYQKPLDLTGNFPKIMISSSISASGNGDGSDRVIFGYELAYFRSRSDKTSRATYIKDRDGDESFNNSGNLSTQEFQQFIAEARAAYSGALSGLSAYNPLSYSLQKNFDGGIYTGQEIIDGSVKSQFPSPGGNIPLSISVNGEDWELNIPGDSSSNALYFFYEARLYIIPIVAPRHPGKKEIYVQIRQNKRTLLHIIPFTEIWDGFVSPLSSQEIEVIIFCGKKTDTEGNISNDKDLSREPELAIKYKREWSQVRIYRLNARGKILSQEVFNNSETRLNSSNMSENFNLDDRNWQKPWLNTYSDYRTERYFLRPFPIPLPAWDHLNSTGEITDLISAYRSHFSDRNVTYIKTIDSTNIVRVLINYLSLGTMTKNGFVYLEPADLYNPNIELDYIRSFSTRLKPAPNYAILRGLVEGKLTKSNYYQVTSSSLIGNQLVDQVTIKKATKFPKLDLPGGLGDLQAGIKAIAFLGG